MTDALCLVGLFCCAQVFKSGAHSLVRLGDSLILGLPSYTTSWTRMGVVPIGRSRIEGLLQGRGLSSTSCFSASFFSWAFNKGHHLACHLQILPRVECGLRSAYARIRQVSQLWIFMP